MNNQPKEPFYIFAAINGVFFDMKSAGHIHGPFLKDIHYPIMKATSVQAFNKLLRELEEKYDTRLVITSRRRVNLPSCVAYLYHNGLQYDKPIYATALRNESRGKNILSYMIDENLSPAQKPTLKSIVTKLLNKAGADKKFKNYVVIDGYNANRLIGIPKSHIIKTDNKNESLTEQQVDEFLKTQNCAEMSLWYT